MMKITKGNIMRIYLTEWMLSYFKYKVGEVNYCTGVKRTVPKLKTIEMSVSVIS